MLQTTIRLHARADATTVNIAKIVIIRFFIAI